MSSIPPSGHQRMGFRPVIRRNSTVKRPLPVPPPVPPILPTYSTRPLLHPEINGRSGFAGNTGYSSSTPCAKIYTGGNGKPTPILPTELVALKEGFLRRWVVPELTNPPAGFIELTPVKKVGLVADAPEEGEAIATIGVLYFRILLRFRLRSDFLRLQVRLNFRIIRLPAASASFVIPGWPPLAP